MHYLDLIKAFEHDYSGVQPYVFEKGDGPKEQRIEIPDEDIVLASPFPKFSMEIDGGVLTSAAGQYCIKVIYCEEQAPNTYRFIFLSGLGDIDLVFDVTPGLIKVYRDGELKATEHSESLYLEILSIVNHQLSKLGKSRFGLVNLSGKAKFKDSTGQNRVYKPLDVVYVSPKRSKSGQPSSGANRGVKWQHSWTVPCHWRRISPDSVGKNRFGERIVKGLTWVRGSIKGEGPLVEKIRRVSR